MSTSLTPLRALRQRRKLTLTEVANALGEDPTNLSRTERGLQQSPALAERLRAYFGLNAITEEQILYPKRFDARGRRMPVRAPRARGSYRATA